MHLSENSNETVLSDDSKDEGWYAIRQRANHALTHFAPPQEGGPGMEPWHHVAHWAILAAELWETPESLEVALEVPGMSTEQLDVEVVAGLLVIRGTRHSLEERSGSRFFLRERAYGRFERVFHLPAAVDEDRARARYRDGVLRVSLPKSRSHSNNRIIVEGGT